MENITASTLMESNQSQLRQLVLENTERIGRQDVIIDKLRMDNSSLSQEMRERYEWLENSRQEHDRSIKAIKECLKDIAQLQKASIIEHKMQIHELKKLFGENSEQMKKSSEKFDREMKERDEKFDREMKESKEEFAREMKERDEKFAKEMKENKEEFAKELKESRDETNAAIRRISVEFLGATGHIVEGLAGSAVDKIFKDAGLDLLHYGKNIRPKQPGTNNKMEVDVLLGNDTFIVPVEVKADFTKRKVKRFVRQMEMFRTLFPEYDGKEVIAAIAAINYEGGADQLAHEYGLLVIRVSSDDIFSIDPFDVKTLRRF
ncbi:MAG: hypothetical protein IJR53_08330 [Bacteroidales bacterium]|nr:hypothetical protein [Bacteroidales bacterium]